MQISFLEAWKLKCPWNDSIYYLTCDFMYLLHSFTVLKLKADATVRLQSLYLLTLFYMIYFLVLSACYSSLHTFSAQVSPSMCSLAHRVTQVQYCSDSSLKVDQWDTSGEVFWFKLSRKQEIRKIMKEPEQNYYLLALSGTGRTMDVSDILI